MIFLILELMIIISLHNILPSSRGKNPTNLAQSTYLRGILGQAYSKDLEPKRPSEKSTITIRRIWLKVTGLKVDVRFPSVPKK